LPTLEQNSLVKCTETERIGIVIKMRRGLVATMALVQWNGTTQTNWVDATELKPIGSVVPVQD